MCTIELCRALRPNLTKPPTHPLHPRPALQPLDVADAIKKEVDDFGEEFLRLEKYVNLNYTGFHKILKKHDRWLTNPCRTFYLQRLQNHNWTRGDYSDVVRARAAVVFWWGSTAVCVCVCLCL